VHSDYHYLPLDELLGAMQDRHEITRPFVERLGYHEHASGRRIQLSSPTSGGLVWVPRMVFDFWKSEGKSHSLPESHAQKSGFYADGLWYFASVWRQEESSAPDRSP